MMRALSGRVRYLLWQRRHRRWLAGRQAAETDPALILDMESESSTLLLAFGGMNSRLGLPPFEFLSLTGGIPVKRMFLRDFRQAWYHRGLSGYGDSLNEVNESLGALIAEHQVRRLVVVGTSAGGYAALLFGTLLGADVVLSFSPQTVLELDVLARMGDDRWDTKLRPLVAADTLDECWVDLGAALPSAGVPTRSGGRTRYEVFYDKLLEVDRLHCERLRGLDGLALQAFDSGGHKLVRALRDTGMLADLLERAVRGSAQEGSATDRRGAMEDAPAS